jgi:hypothetical protein
MKENSLAAPIAMLMELGEPLYARNFVWPDYRSFGIGREHIPALIQIGTDHALINLEDETDPRGWGPVHAWRALGQLQALEAVEPLIRLFHEVRDNDWVIEEMPDVFALIGPAAFPALAAYLRDDRYPYYARMVAATSLMQMALAFPEVRRQSVDALAEQLAEFQRNTPGTNGVLIANLVELEAAEKADLILKVFSEGKVDRFIGGDWRDVKHQLNPSTSQREVRKTTRLEKDVEIIPPDSDLPSASSAARSRLRSNEDGQR